MENVKKKNGLGTAGFVLAILALVFCWGRCWIGAFGHSELFSRLSGYSRFRGDWPSLGLSSPFWESLSSCSCSGRSSPLPKSKQPEESVVRDSTPHFLRAMLLLKSPAALDFIAEGRPLGSQRRDGNLRDRHHLETIPDNVYYLCSMHRHEPHD